MARARNSPLHLFLYKGFQDVTHRIVSDVLPAPHRDERSEAALATERLSYLETTCILDFVHLEQIENNLVGHSRWAMGDLKKKE